MRAIDRFFAVVFLFFALGALAAALYFALHPAEYLWSPHNTLLLVFLPSGFALFCVAIALVPAPNLKINLGIAILFGILGLYIAELCAPLMQSFAARTRGFDTRNKFEVVRSLRDKNIDAYPSIHPSNVLESAFKVGSKAVQPLSGIRDVKTVFCNELGSYYIYDSDEYGFNNPPNSWSSGQPRLALLGDSFTHGACIPDGGSYAELLRKDFSPLLNLGLMGDGPLIMLAKVRELLRPVTPKSVAWFYFEGNDIEDLSLEMVHPVLKNYLENRNFSQHVTEQGNEINQALRSYVDEKYSDLLLKSNSNSILNAVRASFHFNEWLRLWNLRRLLGVVNFKGGWRLDRLNRNLSEDTIVSAFRSIMAEAQSRTRDWGGEFVFIYIPSYQNFEPFTQGKHHPWRSHVMKILNDLRIPVIDLLSDFQRSQDPKLFFPPGGEGHLSADGNARVASRVKEFLDKSNSH